MEEGLDLIRAKWPYEPHMWMTIKQGNTFEHKCIDQGGCHQAKKQSLFIAYSNDLGVTLGVTNQEGLVLHVTHRCVKLLHTRISWCHIWPFPLCDL